MSITITREQYATPSEFKLAIGESGTVNDTFYGKVLKSASMYIDTLCNRLWGSIVATNHIFDRYSVDNQIYVVKNKIYFPSVLNTVTSITEDGEALTENEDFWLRNGGSQSNESGYIEKDSDFTWSRGNVAGTQGIKITCWGGWTSGYYPSDLVQMTIEIAKIYAKQDRISVLSSDGVSDTAFFGEIPQHVKNWIRINRRIVA